MTRFTATSVALAAFCWGLSGGIAGLLLDYGWDAFVLAFCRGAIGLLFVLAWLALRPRRSGLSNRRLWFWSLIAGAGVAGNFSFYFLSIEHGSVAVAATLMYCAPVFVFLISFLAGLEKPSLLKCMSIATVILGIVLLTRSYDLEPGDVTLVGAAAGLLSGLSYAVFIFGFKYASPHGSPQAILTIAFATLVALLLWPAEAGRAIKAFSSPHWPLFATLGVLGAGLSFIIYLQGLNYTLPSVASVVAMVEPVTAALFGIAFLNESLVGIQILGMGLILVTVTGMSVYSSARISGDRATCEHP